MAIIYFDEAINQKNDIISMYNLAHLYFYDDKNRYFENEFIVEKSIKLLIKSSNKHFYPSELLLCIISIIKFGNSPEIIISELNKYDVISSELSKAIHNISSRKARRY